MVLSSILSELSLWQMQRMQKIDGIAVNKGVDQDLFPLEEAYSIQVCVETFSLCHDLLGTILASSPQSKIFEKLKQEASTLNEKTIDMGVVFSPAAMGLSVLQV